MKAIKGLVVAFLMTLTVSIAHAACLDGTVGNCTTEDGLPGKRTCVGGRWDECVANPHEEPIHGHIRPKYVVLTVIYSPPGTAGGRSSSSVVYGSGSTAGTTTSVSKSFRHSHSVSVKSSSGFIGGFDLGLSFGYSHNSSDGKSIDVRKAATTAIRADGPPKDGIDHDRDIIYLWLNPQIEISLTSRSAAWTFTGDEVAVIQWVYVAWLKDPSTMPQGVRQLFEHYGITAQDIANILQRDPFAGGASTPDPNRFKPLNMTFPYTPPFSATDPVPTYTFSVSESSTSAITSSTQDEYDVGLSVSAGAEFMRLYDVAIQNQNSWKWTHTTSLSRSTGTTESASVTVGGPAFGYTGSTLMGVHYDTIYKTFLFTPIEHLDDAPLSLNGRIVSSAGKPLVGKGISVTTNGITHRTFTDAQGQYRFFENISGPVRLEVDGLTRTVSQVPADTIIDVRMREASFDIGMGDEPWF